MGMLRLRAALLREVRRFFESRGYWEADTPILSADATVDAHLDPFELTIGGTKFFLQTSPEFAMKRLLAAGSGSIYQISRVFRDGELGARHNPEFTMIEWYRVGGDYQSLMTEVGELVSQIAGVAAPERITYQAAFERFAGFDPHAEADSSLRDRAVSLGMAVASCDSKSDLASGRDEWLNFLLAAVVEPNLGTDRPVFVYGYPATQAALARIDPGPPAVAQRFELYVQGVELCNGYQELLDPDELRERSIRQNAIRRSLGKRELPVDSRLLAAMRAGLPPCAGVALGFDRLLMIAAKSAELREVLPFFWDRA
jgi:lysyl-tRNA synthetase class 2